jgi:hypothetical protein|tara:strand:- start:2235 stop:3104 length:870 start_codon:yes stop_codon:yes gene_type:complete
MLSISDNICIPQIIFTFFITFLFTENIYFLNFYDAFTKFLIFIVVSILLSFLCNIGLTIISFVLAIIIIYTLYLRYDFFPIKLIQYLFREPKYTTQQTRYNLIDTSYRLDRDDIRKELYGEIYSYYDLSNNDLFNGDLSNNKLLDWNIKNDYINNKFVSKYRWQHNTFIDGWLNNFQNLMPTFMIKTNEKNINNEDSIESQSERLDRLYGNNFNEETNSLDYDPNKLYNNKYARNINILKGSNISLSRKYNNNEPCPINETSDSWKLKTGMDCNKVCAPGKSNKNGICI